MDYCAVTNFLPPSEQLLALKMAVDSGSFTSAARELSISQSAVSHQITKLERSLGVRLLTRSARGLALTDAGEILMAAINEPLSNLLAAFESYSGRTSAGRLKIQVESAFSAAWLAPRLGGFLERFPSLRLEQYRTSNLRFAEGIELAVKWGSGTWPDLEADPLLGLYYTPVCSPDFVRSGELRDVQDLLKFSLLHDRKQRDWQRWFKAFGLHYGQAKAGHLADDAYILIEMAIARQGIALCAPQILRRELAAGTLVRPFPDLRLYTDERYYILTKKDARLTTSARLFIQWMKHEAAKDFDDEVASSSSESRGG